MQKRTLNKDCMQLWKTKILSVINVQNFYDGKIKTVFDVKTNLQNNICVYWGRLNAKAGDDVIMKGFFAKNGIFIVDSLYKTNE